MTRLKKGAETVALRNLYHASHGMNWQEGHSITLPRRSRSRSRGRTGRDHWQEYHAYDSVKFTSHNPKPTERCKANVFPLTVFKMNDPGAKRIAKQPSHPKADTWKISHWIHFTAWKCWPRRDTFHHDTLQLHTMRPPARERESRQWAHFPSIRINVSELQFNIMQFLWKTRKLIINSSSQIFMYILRFDY